MQRGFGPETYHAILLNLMICRQQMHQHHPSWINSCSKLFVLKGEIMFVPNRTPELPFFTALKQFVDNEVLPYTRDWEANRAFPDAIWTRMG